MANYKKVLTSKELVAKADKIAKSYKTIYALGCSGNPITVGLVDNLAGRLPSWYTKARIENIKAVANKGYFGFDCSNLIKCILWDWDGTRNHGSKNDKYINYASNTVPDTNADGLIQMCSDISTDFTYIPYGSALWFKGHIGIYIGIVNGVRSYIDAAPSTGKVKICPLNYQKWVKHGWLPWVERVNPYTKPTATVSQKSSKQNILWVQYQLNRWIASGQAPKGTKYLTEDGVYGQNTANVVLAFQKFKGWTTEKVSGFYTGIKTVEALIVFE